MARELMCRQPAVPASAEGLVLTLPTSEPKVIALAVDSGAERWRSCVQ